MLASSHFGESSFQDIMVDDNMEISSEHDYNPGDEDIDIDIDLTGGQVDEDHILEDVMSNTGFDNDRNQRLTPPTSHDDLMVDDDDNESAKMEDAGALEVGDAQAAQEATSHNIEDRGQAMSYDAAEEINIEFDDEDTDIQFHQGTEASWEYQEVLPEPISNLDEHPPGYDEIIEHDEEHSPQQKDHTEIEETAVGRDAMVEKNDGSNSTPSRAASSVASPPRLSPKLEDSLKEPPEAPATIGKVLSCDGVEETNDKCDDHEHDEVESIANIENPDDLGQIHKVKVIYQDVEYDLFSSSASDDSESFFLSDLSVGKLPLAGFFAAIRIVINEDILEDEQLLITIEDLGLDFQEEYSSTQSITLWSIMELHQLLQKNDGVEDLQPLYILLDKKINSSYRFEYMVARAAEGAGLAELTMWDDSSEHLELSAEDVELHEEDHEHTQEPNEDGDEQETTQENDISAATKVEEKEGSESFDFNNATELHKSTSDESSAQNSAEQLELEQSTAGVTNLSEDEAQVSSTTDVQYPPVSEVSITVHANGKYVEEDDLIDYSDDELDPHRSKQYVTTQPNEIETDDSRIYNEFEKKDEELKRVSLSRAKENEDVDKKPANSSDVLNTSVNQVIVSLKDEDGVDYEDDLPEETSGPVNEVTEHEDPANGSEAYRSAESKQDDNKLLIDGDIATSAPLSEFPEEFDLGEDQAEGTEHDQQYFDDELDLGDDDGDEHDHDQSNLGPSEEFTKTDSHQIGDADESQSLPKDLNETISLGDLVDTESAGSENTLVAQPELATEEPEDEIGYDDDEEDAVAIHKVASQTGTSSPLVPAGPNKRARSDASFEDGMERNGAKRTRS